ncbi:MAG: hypothetical protein JST00_25405 [Deltaproteobacteria bacterium]|nr:hypothetical protein [Deltaproteobacteria bacterium]
MRSEKLCLCTVALALAAASCGGAPDIPSATPAGPTAPTAAGKDPSAPKQDDAAAKAAAVEKLTSEEAKSGTCDAEHKASLDKLLDAVEAGMKAKNGDDGKPLGLQTVGKRVLALGPNARGVQMTVTGKGTEVHVLAYGVKEISMDVLAGTTAATTLRSPHQRSATTAPMSIDVPKAGTITDVQSDSRQVSIKPGQPLEVKLTGQGCAGLVTFLRP